MGYNTKKDRELAELLVRQYEAMLSSDLCSLVQHLTDVVQRYSSQMDTEHRELIALKIDIISVALAKRSVVC